MHSEMQSKEIKYNCAICGEKLRSEKSLKEHILLHADKFSCEQCKQEFNQKSLFEKHICVKYEKTYSDMYLLHMKSHNPATTATPLPKEGKSSKSSHNKAMCTCNVCGKTMSTPGSLHTHKKQHYPETCFCCADCGKKFTKKTELTQHINFVHLKTIKFDCTICGSHLSSKNSLALHTLRHTGNYKFRCKHCQQGFTHKGTLDKHIRVKHEGFRYICFPCDKSYSDKTWYALHMDSHNPETTVSGIECTICNEILPNKRVLILHKRKHTDYEKAKGESCVCDICGLSLRKSSLPLHKKLHEGVNVTCNICDMVFKRKEALKIHNQKLHWNMGKFKCLICGHQVASKRSLAQHSLRHTDNYKFNCEQCKQGFTEDHHLQEHIRVKHDGFRYICFPCDKIYTNKSSYTLHMNLHNPTIASVLECTICKKVLPNRWNLIIHRQSHYSKVNSESCVCEICGKTLLKSSLPLHKKLHERKANFTCSICDMAFVRKDALKYHCQKLHWNIGKVKCLICGRHLSSKRSLALHTLRHTNNYKFRCEQCKQGFTHKGTLDEHIRVKHEGFRYICFPCDKIYFHKHWYLLHMDSHNPATTASGLECTICNAVLPNRMKLIVHRTKHTDRAKAKRESCICDICGISLLKSSLPLHKKLHEGKANFTCSICDKVFKRKESLKSHCQKVHWNIVKFNCLVCGRHLSGKKSLQHHMAAYHTKQYKFHCKYCNKGFLQKTLLQNHIRIQHEGFRYICFPCDKSYSDKTWYTFHMDSHNPATTAPAVEHKCNICNDMLPDKGKLILHKRTHFKKSFICDICGISLQTSTHLFEHKMRHKGESRFMCAICGKTFVTHAGLRSHRRVHTKEKPYECSECGKAFSEKNYLKCHKRIHSGERPFSCRICEKKYISSSALKSHSNRRHGILLSDWKTNSNKFNT